MGVLNEKRCKSGYGAKLAPLFAPLFLKVDMEPNFYYFYYFYYLYFFLHPFFSSG